MLVTENEERILETILPTGMSLSQSLIAYEINDRWFLPMKELVDLLEFDIKVSVLTGEAEGHLFSENERFRLDVKECLVWTKNGKESIVRDVSGNCDSCFIKDNEIYVDALRLYQWWEIKFDILPHQSKLVLYPKSKLPMQLRKERDSRDKYGKKYSYQKKEMLRDAQYSKDFIFWDGPFTDVRVGSSSQNEHFVDGAVGAQALNHDFKANASIARETPSLYRMSLGKKSPSTNLLGHLQAREYSVGDLLSSQQGLISYGRYYRGLMLSNFPFYMPAMQVQEVVAGDLAPGWEVELYVNQVYWGRQFSDQGRFLFREILLGIGKNEVRLEYYGPKGQRKTERRVYLYNDSHIGAERFNYRVHVGEEKNKEFYIFSGQSALSKHFVSKLSYTQLPLGVVKDLEQSRYTSAQLGLLFPNVSVTAQHVSQLNRGYAQEFGVQGLVGSNTLSARTIHLQNYRSELYNSALGSEQIQEQQLSWLSYMDWSIGLGQNIEWLRKKYKSTEENQLFKHRLSASIHPFMISHLWQFQYVPTKFYVGDFDISFYKNFHRHKLGARYLGNEVRELGYEISGPLWLTESHQFFAQVKRQIVEKSNFFILKWTKDWQSFYTTLEGSLSSRQSVLLRMILGTSFVPNYKEKSILYSSQPRSETTALLIRFYEDKNRNNVFDENVDVPLFGQNISINQQEQKKKSSKEGYLFIDGLASYTPLELSGESFRGSDPFLQSTQATLKIYGEPGRTLQVDFPYQRFGEIQGMAEYRSKTGMRSRRGAVVKLYDEENKEIAKTRTDSEGLFDFYKLPPGQYKLSVDETNTLMVTVPTEGGIVDGVLFTL